MLRYTVVILAILASSFQSGCAQRSPSETIDAHSVETNPTPAEKFENFSPAQKDNIAECALEKGQEWTNAQVAVGKIPTVAQQRAVLVRSARVCVEEM